MLFLSPGSASAMSPTTLLPGSSTLRVVDTAKQSLNIFESWEGWWKEKRIRRIYNVCSRREVSAKKNEEKNKEEMLYHMEEQALEDYKVY